LRPSTLIAETIGGICSISPMKARAARTTCSLVTCISACSSTAPDASSVSVAMPNTTRARYALPASCK